MEDYSLDKDIEIQNTDPDFDEDWEPEEVVAIDDLRLDPEAAKIYIEIRKARERKNTGPRTKGD